VIPTAQASSFTLQYFIIIIIIIIIVFVVVLGPLLFEIFTNEVCGRFQLKCYGTPWHTEGKWRGNWRMEWVVSTLHTTSEHGVSSTTTADAHTSAASSRLNWRPRRFKRTRPFRRKTKSGYSACAITFQLASTVGYSNFLPFAGDSTNTREVNLHLHGKVMSIKEYWHSCSKQTNAHPLNMLHSLVLSLEGRAWQEPEPSHVTGMALAHCILGKFLGVVCHCFLPPLHVPSLAARCLLAGARRLGDPSSGRWNCGLERFPVVFLPKFRDLLHAVNLRHGTDGFLSLRRKTCWGFFRPKNPTTSAGFEPANLGTKGQHATTPRPLKPCKICLSYIIGVHWLIFCRSVKYSPT